MPTIKLAKWKILLSKFDILYVTKKAIKAQALSNHMVGITAEEKYNPLKTYFPDKEVAFLREDISEEYNGWRLFFDGSMNFKRVGIRANLVSNTGQFYPVLDKHRLS